MPLGAYRYSYALDLPAEWDGYNTIRRCEATIFAALRGSRNTLRDGKWGPFKTERGSLGDMDSSLAVDGLMTAGCVRAPLSTRSTHIGHMSLEELGLIHMQVSGHGKRTGKWTIHGKGGLAYPTARASDF